MKTFIICLSKFESSYISALKVQKTLDEFGANTELFEGTYGNEAKEIYKEIGRECHSWGIKGPHKPISEEYRQQVSAPGVIGCFDSHYRLWQKCVEMNEPIFIFEDDVIVMRPYFPTDWVDVLSVAFSHEKKMRKYIHYLENPKGMPQSVQYGQATMPGNGGYAIKPHAAKILVEEYKNSYLPADNAINQYLVRIQLHNYMMGRARSKHEGNVSLIRTRAWDETPKIESDE